MTHTTRSAPRRLPASWFAATLFVGSAHGAPGDAAVAAATAAAARQRKAAFFGRSPGALSAGRWGC